MTSTNQQARTTLTQNASSSIQHVTLYTDPAGGAWVRTFLPIDQASVNRLEQPHIEGELVLHREPLPDEIVSRETEMTWVHDHLNELAAEHAGEWIALDGAQLIAVAADLPELLARAADSGHPHPFVTVVPAGPDIPFIG
jgi:hypothetical protein